MADGESLVELLTGDRRHDSVDQASALPAAAALDGVELAVEVFSPSLFEAEPGEFRLLQPVWGVCVSQQWAVASPLFPIVLAVVFYFACMLPFTLVDLYGSHWACVQRYKIQPGKVVRYASADISLLNLV